MSKICARGVARCVVLSVACCAGTGWAFAQSTQTQADTGAAAATPETGPKTEAGALELETIDVQGQQTGAGNTSITADGYVPLKSTTGTKTNTPLIEVPQTISTVTRQNMDDRNVQNLVEALAYSPGVRVGAFGFDPRFDSFYVRGFDATYTGIYRDGLREQNGNFSIYKTEPYGLEGISVLQGPASALYGAGSPGGVIDLTTKRPTSTPIRDVWLQVGNYDRYQGQFDFAGAIPQDDRFTYRITGLLRQADTELASVPDDRAYIAPALSWNIDEDTSFTFLSEYMHNKTGGNAAYYMDADGQASGLPSGDSAFGDFVQDQYRVGYEFSHAFNDVFTARQNFRFARITAEADYTQINSISEDGLTATRSTGQVGDAISTVAVDNQLEADFATWAIEHKVLTGLNYNFADGSDKIGFGAAPDLDLVSLNYGQQYIPAPGYNYLDVKQNQDQLGVYAQDQAKFGPWVLTLGGRQDWTRTTTNNMYTGANDQQSDSAFTGRVGLTYVTPWGIAPYASYSTSFAPVLGTNAEGQAFKPSTGEQQEVGVKYYPNGWNAVVTASLFNITQQNVLSPDPNNLAFQTQMGEVRSRGFEIEAQATLALGLSVTASYTYLDLEVTQGNPEYVGKQPSGIPPQSFALWADYTIPSGVLEGLGAGAGVRYTGTSYGNDTNTFSNDPITLVDAAFHYDFGGINPKLKGLSAQINATNLLDENYTTCQAGYCYRGQGRAVIAGMRYQW